MKRGLSPGHSTALTSWKELLHPKPAEARNFAAPQAVFIAP
jgi:hypothetical protein